MSTTYVETAKENMKYWYIPLIVGFIFIGVGLYTFASPASSFLALSIFFTVSFIVAGLSEIAFAFSNRNSLKGWGSVLALGIMNTLVGILLFANPALSMMSLPLYVGFLVLFRSISSIGLSLELKDSGEIQWGFLLLLGFLGLIFSFILIWNPAFAGMTLVFWTGFALVSSGIISVFLAFRLKRIKTEYLSE